MAFFPDIPSLYVSLVSLKRVNEDDFLSIFKKKHASTKYTNYILFLYGLFFSNIFEMLSVILSDEQLISFLCFFDCKWK